MSPSLSTLRPSDAPHSTTDWPNFSPPRPLPTPPSVGYRSCRPLPAIPSWRPPCAQYGGANSSQTSEIKDIIPDQFPSLARKGAFQTRPNPSKAGASTDEQNASGNSRGRSPPSVIGASFSAEARENRTGVSLDEHRQPTDVYDSPDGSRQFNKQAAALPQSVQSPKERRKQPPALTLAIPQPHRLSLDSQTQRTPSLVSPTQALSPVIFRRQRGSGQPGSSLSLPAREAISSCGTRMQSLPETDNSVAFPPRQMVPSRDGNSDGLISSLRLPSAFHLGDTVEAGDSGRLTKPETGNGGEVVEKLYCEKRWADLTHFRFPPRMYSSVPSLLDNNLSIQGSEDDCHSGECYAGANRTRPNRCKVGMPCLRNVDNYWVTVKAMSKPARSFLPVGAGARKTSTARKAPSRVASRMWYKEKGGKRWEQRDLNEVLAELRKL